MLIFCFYRLLNSDRTSHPTPHVDWCSPHAPCHCSTSHGGSNVPTDDWSSDVHVSTPNDRDPAPHYSTPPSPHHHPPTSDTSSRMNILEYFLVDVLIPASRGRLNTSYIISFSLLNVTENLVCFFGQLEFVTELFFIRIISIGMPDIG